MLEALGNILPTKDSHDLGNFATHTIIDTVHTADTAPEAAEGLHAAPVDARQICFGFVAELITHHAPARF